MLRRKAYFAGVAALELRVRCSGVFTLLGVDKLDDGKEPSSLVEGSAMAEAALARLIRKQFNNPS
ncbi:hypothetical protein ACVWXO_000518 [Bradyrhizobium sp. LM2.7]